MTIGFIKSEIPWRKHMVEIVAYEEADVGDKMIIHRTIGLYDPKMKVAYDWEVIHKDGKFWSDLFDFVDANCPDDISDYPHIDGTMMTIDEIEEECVRRIARSKRLK